MTASPESLEIAGEDGIRFAQVTDCHLMDEPDGRLRGINTRATLEAVLESIGNNHPRLDFLLFTGDISQTGSRASYGIFASALASLNCPVYCIPGNHDDPAGLHDIIPTSPVSELRTIPLGANRLQLLTSWIAGKHHGRIPDACLRRLGRQLARPPGGMDIIALHHPPVATGCWLDGMGLVNRADLYGELARVPQPTLLLCGHIHQTIDRQFGNTRVLTAPSSCYQFKPGAATMTVDETQTPGYRYFHIESPHRVHTRVYHLAH